MHPHDPLEVDLFWIRLQQPVRVSPYPDAYLLLLSALESGWEVAEPVRLQHAAWKAAVCVYVITLHHRKSGMIQQITLPKTLQVEKLLRLEGLCIAAVEKVCCTEKSSQSC